MQQYPSKPFPLPLCGLVKVIQLIEYVSEVPHDLWGVLQDGMKLQEGVGSILSPSQLLVDQPQVVQGLAASGLHTQGLSEEFGSFLILASPVQTAALVHQSCTDR